MIQSSLLVLVVATATSGSSLGPGDHTRTLHVDGWTRSYVVHVPEKYDGRKPFPVVLLFHGVGMNAGRMIGFCGMNEKADEAGFIAVYPNGTGVGPFLAFNSGGLPAASTLAQPDDVAFTAKLLDDLAAVVRVDPQRVFAAGMSNGAMMCYRLAAHLADRIAAIAAVAGTMALENAAPSRPVPVLHIHGTQDRLVPFVGPGEQANKYVSFKSVDETIATWTKLNGCRPTPEVAQLPDQADDGMRVTRKVFPADNRAEVILLVVDGGGHTWPGREPLNGFIGKSTKDIAANDVIWEFFERHPLPH
jgi:polyhydroxybutyrate depolymerase